MKPRRKGDACFGPLFRLECSQELGYKDKHHDGPLSRSDDGLKKAIQQGLGAAWPICVGYVPIGLALGLPAQKSGLSPIEIGLMSVFVFAGSLQFIAVAMISAGSAPLDIIMTTLVVNLRHLLMSS